MSARHIAKHQAPLGTAHHLHDKLHVVVPLSNSRRWRVRYEHLNDNIAHFRAQGTEPWVIEGAFGNRAHALTDPGNPRHIRVRMRDELWHKENLIAAAVARLPHDWEYLCWVDGDVSFVRPDVINETVQVLQHHRVVQMFSEAWDVSHTFETVARHEGFCKSYHMGRDIKRIQRGSYSTPAGPKFNIWHSGFAWAIRRDTYDAIGGLLDWAILGSADKHMACAFIGRADKSAHAGAHPNYRKWLMRWQALCEKHVRRDIGVVDGTLMHRHHGPKSRRLYWDRWRILVDNQFDPERDLKRDSQGLWQLHDDGSARHRHLRDGIRAYFAQRNEDDPCL